MLKHIGTRARQQIERILGIKVFLELFVKVREGWRDNIQRCRRGYRLAQAASVPR